MKKAWHVRWFWPYLQGITRGAIHRARALAARVIDVFGGQVDKSLPYIEFTPEP